MRDSDRPRRKKARSSRGDSDGVPMWAKVGAGVIAILGLIGTIVRFAERRAKPDAVPNAAVAPVEPVAPVPAPKEQPPAPKRRPANSEPPAAARERVATITRIYEAPSEVPGQPFDLVIEYQFAAAPAHDHVMNFTNATTDGGLRISAAGAKGVLRWTPDRAGQFDGETRFWIERWGLEQPRRRLSNVYTYRR
jgi:hypothetical protein